MRVRSVLPALLSAASLSLITCASPTDPAEPRHGLVALSVAAPATLFVHENHLVEVSGIDATGGAIYPLPTAPKFTSSDSTIVSVSPEGVITGLRRGSATVRVSAEGVDTSFSLRVYARVRLAPADAPQWRGDLIMAIGDSIQFSAAYTDVDGNLLAETPPTAWATDSPGIASVTDAGLVVTYASDVATLTATTPDGQAQIQLRVTEVVAGEPATVRFVHALRGVGPLTFHSNKGAAVTLEFGEWTELPVTSGTLIVNVEGLPPGAPEFAGYQHFVNLIHGGDRFSLFALGGTTQAFLTGVWPERRPMVGSDSGLVRILQGWEGYGVMYLTPSGGPPNGLPAECYFDPTNVSPYYGLPAGTFDVVMQQKYGSKSVARLHASALAGQAFTGVITGNGPDTMELLEFPDP